MCQLIGWVFLPIILWSGSKVVNFSLKSTESKMKWNEIKWYIAVMCLIYYQLNDFNL